MLTNPPRILLPINRNQDDIEHKSVGATIGRPPLYEYSGRAMPIPTTGINHKKSPVLFSERAIVKSVDQLII